MTDGITYKRLPDEPCLSEDQLFSYMDGKLGPKEMHEVEKHLIACPFCADAYEGLQVVSKQEKTGAWIPFSEGISAGENTDSHRRGKVISIFEKRRVVFALAASVVIVLAVVVAMRLMVNETTKSDLAQADKVIPLHDSSTIPLSETSPPETKSDKPVEKADANRNAAPIAIGGAGEPAYEPETVQADIAAVEDNGTFLRTEEESEGLFVTKDQKAAVASGSAEPITLHAEEERKAEEDSEKLMSAQKKKSVVKEQSERYKDAGTVPATTAPPASVEHNGTQNDDKTTAGEQTQTLADSVIVQQSQYKGPFPLTATSEDLDLSYSRGVVLLDNGKALESLPFFNLVLEKPEHKHFEDAQWKKAAALLMLNRKEEAKTLLNEIVKKNGKYKTQAEEKLKTL
ncbi:MAG TPA: zf-HC2 domain-containing protein [Bacteroidia bacterium]|nr:zf-HC2 domain-containing protein [Bacteroidia bacterium]